MIIPDFTISWTSSRRATVAWEGDSPGYWHTLFVDGRAAATKYGQGSLSVVLSLNEQESHSIVIVQHSAGAVYQEPPNSLKMLRPTVRWVGVSHAAEYLVYLVDDDEVEYLLQTIPAGDLTEYSWQFAVQLPIRGLGSLRLKVLARGSWGLCETPALAIGRIAGYPPRVKSVTSQESSTGLEVILASE